MAETVFSSAGVFTREIDLSQPSTTGPTGIPACVIGTSRLGPAFVPITVANYQDYVSIFGDSLADDITGENTFGPMAVNEWLRNQGSCTFIRVLGVGDSKKRNSDGTVTNAGYVVGSRLVQTSTGNRGNNAYGVVKSSNDAPEGRLYFLGCFMSESNGSTIFSSAGLQGTDATGNAASFIPTLAQGIVMGGTDYSGIAGVATITFTQQGQPTITLSFTASGSPAPSASGNNINVRVVADIEQLIDRIILAIAGTTSSGNIEYGSSTGIPNITGTKVDLGSGNFGIKLTYGTVGTVGNLAKFKASHANLLGSSSAINTDIPLAGGLGISNHAVPILRAVLMAPSGTILHLSGNYSADSRAPSLTETSAQTGTQSGRKGALTGSITDIDKFTLLINGYDHTVNGATYKNVITASFNPQSTSGDYLTEALNTDPSKIEEAGHLLYAHFPISAATAVVTGSGIIVPGREKYAGSLDDTAFILTSSLGRNVKDGSGIIPRYENWQDRFTHAETPFFVSQGSSGDCYDLFKLVALSPGEDFSARYKVSIELEGGATNQYGSFSILIRDAKDTDDTRRVIDGGVFTGLNLNPASDNYIARVIGDQHFTYEFDVNQESQKLVLDGQYPVRNTLVRVVLSDDLKNGNVPKDHLPFGFRGTKYLNISGSNKMTPTDAAAFSATDILGRLREPPIPFRDHLLVGAGSAAELSKTMYWGVRPTHITDLSDKNLSGQKLNASLRQGHNLFYPTHETVKFSTDNKLDPSIVGTKDDSDNYNNNFFSLSNVKVVTGSDTIANSTAWGLATYVRGGSIPDDPNSADKTRGLALKDFREEANVQYLKFSTFFQGGFSGLEIFDRHRKALSNVSAVREMEDAAQFGTSDSTIAAYRKALEIAGDKTAIDIQLLTTPGMREPAVTNFGIQTAEDRFDCLYIMDVEDADADGNVITDYGTQDVSLEKTADKFAARLPVIQSSFAASYFPNLIMPDVHAGTSKQFPPSVGVLGVYGNSDSISGFPWFSPSGMTRGKPNVVEADLNTGLGQTKVTITERPQLDKLYREHINPIADFQGRGLVVWGQKTLSTGGTALDRVNVRRLLIYIRRKIRVIAESLLFEPNRESTLSKFSTRANQVLDLVLQNSGVDRFKVIIDTSTTTQADIENNTIRGKIFVQPTRAVEFVAVDFVVSNTGEES